MRPAWSIVLFTTLAGAGQGLAVVLAIATLAGADPAHAPFMLAVATALLVAGLAASFFHLGHPLRAWRAVLMWRTSWMSREVIVLPAFIALVVLWAIVAAAGPRLGLAATWLAVAVIAAACVLWYCTAMIYACIRFVQEWAHPVTIANYTLIGLSCGIVLAGALAAAGGQPWSAAVGRWAIAVTLLAWAVRGWSLHRNRTLRQRSTLQSATGIRAARVVQTSMGMTGGSFNTREFFHHASRAALRHVKLGMQLLAFAAPVLLVGWSLSTGAAWPWFAAVALQLPGVLAERWFFFAQARHPQNLYYDVVS